MDKGPEEGTQPPKPGTGQRSNGEQIINLVVSSVSALIKQKKFEDALDDINKALHLHGNHEKLLEKKIKVLRIQGRFQEAYNEALQWLKREPRHPTAIKELKRLKTVLNALHDQDSDEEVPSPSVSVQRPDPVDVPLQPTSLICDHVTSSIHTNKKASKDVPQIDLHCSFCNMTFDSKSDLDTHCRSDEHKKNITSDEGHSWKYRPPPRGLASEEYMICRRYAENGRCPYADKCIQAHSKNELEEWRERFKFKRQQLQMAKDKHLHGNTYPEQLMEKLMTAEYPKSVMVANVDYAKVIVNTDLKVSMISKKCTHAWTFTITSKICILRVFLLDEAVSNYFYIASISVGPKKTQKYQNLENVCQEWKNPDITMNKPGEYVYRVKIVFKTDIYGTFRQTLVFDFGSEPVLSRDMQVESAPVTDTEKVLSEIRLSQQGHWRADAVQVIDYKQKNEEDEVSHELLRKYLLPEMDQFRFSEHLMHSPSKDNYRLWMHQMLYVEELAQIDKISKFNITTSLQLVNRFLLMPGSLSTAKFAKEGELFARMKLEDDLSVDSVAGRLILKSTNIVWLGPHTPSNKATTAPQKVYEAFIEDRGKNFIFLRLSKECVEDLQLTCDQEFSVEVQFQLNRIHLCEMHHAIDTLRSLDIVFPSQESISKLPDLQDWDWKEELSEKTNEDQKDAIQKVTAYSNMPGLPPLLIVGPFGTGKTHTVAQCARHVLLEPHTRILICTHSNSAADIYIKEFLHPYVQEGFTEARPLRVYYRHRWIQTVPEGVLQYCIQEMRGPMAGTFRKPTLEDVERHRVIVTTLSTARLLSDLELPDDFFTHIFVDEAAQALECEVLIPLSLAGSNTRIVLAGDHMQMSPEVFSDFGRQQQFHKSLLERLYDLYPDSSPSKVMLCENYRANRAIIEFTSELFYDHRLKASKDPVAHSVYYPLTFFTARGEEVQHENSSGYYNIAEIYEVIEQVEHLQKHWPPEWGDFDDSSICVVAPYADQVMQIRGELRKRKMFKISVERVVNVQGKQFRVIVMSTVRTRHKCSTDAVATDKLDLGFLSNVKLLNTAITRAQSLVIVVGDPVSLCLVGKCSKIWEYYLEVCNDNNSFFGMTWPHLHSLLKNVEMTKTYILNPLAPEFIPKNIYPGAHGSPVLMAPHGLPLYQQKHPTGAPHVGLRGQLPPQMYFGNPYMPMMYPPYQPAFHPLYGPVMFRPQQGLYPTPGGKGAFRAQMYKGHQGYKSKGPAQAPLPVQRDDEDRASSASPKSDSGAPLSGQPATSIHRDPTTVQGMGTPKKTTKRVLVNMPRVPLQQQQPYFAYPHYVMPSMDDPRFAAMAPQPPFYYHYGTPPRHPYLVQHPLHVQVQQTRASSRSVSPASSSDSISRMGLSVSPNGSDVTVPSVSSLSPNSAQGHHIQVLPNVKHVPSHLRHSTPSSNNNSRSSTPVGPSSPVTQQYPSESSNRPLGEMEFKARKRQHSGPRPVSQSPSFSSQSSHESSSSPVQNGEKPAAAISAARVPDSGLMAPRTVEPTPQTTANKQASSLSSRLPKQQLKLNTTGFSRQFSDELGTPTAIHNIVRMIEEGEEDVVTRTDFVFDNDMSYHRNKPSPPTGKLFLNLAAAGSEASKDRNKSSYAGAVRQQLPSYKDTNVAPEMLEPQTPMTPAGFQTPGTDMNSDPLEILRNLHIDNDNLNRSAHGHFP